MKDVVLIDSDIVCYRIGFTTQDVPVEIAEIRTDELIRRIIHETEAKDYKCFLSGEENFRYSIYPEYKGNRLNKPKPTHLQAIREHIVRYHGGKVVSGYEADDELSIEQLSYGDRSIIASIDKDLLQVTGWHYDFVKGITRFISPFQGLRNFYSQVISGDGADNIPSFDGKVRHQVPKFIERLIEPLNGMTEEGEMYEYCRQVYLDDSIKDTWVVEMELHRNAKLLHLLRKEGDEWLPPGQKQD